MHATEEIGLCLLKSLGGSGREQRAGDPLVMSGVSINGGTPKWLLIGKKPIKIDDLGETPFQKTSK